MDFHAKERIVGAAVLVALAVWLIPWLLDGPEPEPAAAVVPELQLPLPDEAAPTQDSEATRDPAGEPLTSEPLGGEPAVSESPPASIQASPAPEAGAPVLAAVVDEAPPAARVPPRDASGESAPWSVQAGSFGDRANAVQLARRVAGDGFDAQVSEFQSMHRVRVDGYATRAAAEADASALSAHGIPARVMPAD